MAEYYSAELAEKVIRGHTENALKCKYNGGTPTFGYTIDNERHYQIDPRTAPVVLEMFTRYDNGATMKEIRDYLNETGVTTVRGKAIDLNFVAAILHNRKFLGEYKYREIVIPNGIPSIVPQDLFDRVQDKLAKNKKAPARHKAEDDYLLTTKLFCGTCGAMMVGESGTSSTERKYHYYRCVNTKKNHTCNAKHKSVKKLPLENAVVNSVMAKIMDDAFVEYITDAVMDLQGRESSALPALRKQLEDAERGITNMLNAIQAGIINASTKQRLDELEDAKQKIELQIIQEEMKHPLLSREDVTYWICRFRTLDVTQLEERRRLIDSFVNSVTIFDDYILITFNYKEGSERLTFEDIKSSDLKSVGGPEKSLEPQGFEDFSFTFAGYSRPRIYHILWYFRPFFGVVVAKLLQIFKTGLSIAPQLVREFWGSKGRFAPVGAVRRKIFGVRRVFAAHFSLRAGPEGVPNFLSGLGLPGAPVIMGIDLQRHVQGAVPGQVLDFLNVQAGLEQAGDVRVPQNVCRNMRVRQFPFHQLPHAPIGGFGQRLVVLHGDHVLRMRGFLSLRQPRLQFLGKGEVSLDGFRLQVLGNRGLALFDNRVVPDMDDLRAIL